MRRRFALSAIAMQAAAASVADAAAVPSLRSLHEALASGPLGTRYTRASPLGGSLWELSFAAQDLRTKARTAQSHIVDLDRAGDHVAATFPMDAGTAVTRSPEHGLELRQRTCDDGKKLVVEMWDSGGACLARRVIDGVGAKMLPTGVFGTPQFSPSGNAVTFAAERPPAGTSAEGYWPLATEADEAEEASTFVGGRYELGDMRSTGEALLVHNSQIVVWEWRADSVRIVQAESVLPEGSLPPSGVAVPVHPTFDGTDDGGLVFVCHLLPPWRPGISACLNRPTRLYHLSSTDAPTGSAEDGSGAAATARCLTPSLYLAHMPRLSPDGRVLAFVSKEMEFTSHTSVFELRTMAWPPPASSTNADSDGASTVILPVARAPPAVCDGTAFAGVCGFHDELSTLSWLDDTTLIMHAVAGHTLSTFMISPSADGEAAVSALRPPGIEGSVSLLGTSGGTVIVQCSSLRAPPSIWSHSHGKWTCLVDVASFINGERAGGVHARTDMARAVLDEAQGARLECVTLPESEGGAEALCLLPRSAGRDGSGRVPWVLKLHGGPHAVSPDAFNLESALFLARGIAVVFPNYRGSTGYGVDFLEALQGHIGEKDVEDCVGLTRAALARLPELDPSRGACYGGSHGGFLTAWLLGCDARELYTCGVLWNPVVDLPGMIGSTDIPEWVMAEALRGNTANEATWPLSAEQYVELVRRSPMSVVDKVDTPALMLLGAADQRVPHKQGRLWVAALQHRRQARLDAPEVRALEFPGEGHSIASVEGNAHAVQSAVAWLAEKLRA